MWPPCLLPPPLLSPGVYKHLAKRVPPSASPLHRYDDYDYGEVNQLLERSLKVYIKTVACYPEKTTRRMYTHFWHHFKHSEKVLWFPHPSALPCQSR